MVVYPDTASSTGIPSRHRGSRTGSGSASPEPRAATTEGPTLVGVRGNVSARRGGRCAEESGRVGWSPAYAEVATDIHKSLGWMPARAAGFRFSTVILRVARHQRRPGVIGKTSALSLALGGLAPHTRVPRRYPMIAIPTRSTSNPDGPSVSWISAAIVRPFRLGLAESVSGIGPLRNDHPGSCART